MALGGLGDLIGISGGSFSKSIVAFYVILPIVFWLIVGMVGIFAYLWFRKFKFIVYVHSQRADGVIIKSKLRGGFFTNPKTKVERLRILNFRRLSDLKTFIPPPPNRFIKREDGKDVIHLMRTTGQEYIPILAIKEDKYLGAEKAIFCSKCKKNYVLGDAADKIAACPECKNKDIEKVTVLIEKTNFQVHEDLAKDWLEIATSEDERKYSIGGWLLDHQVMVIAITWGAVMLMGTMFIMGQVENAINMGGSVVSACRAPKEQIVSLGLGFVPFIFRSFNK